MREWDVAISLKKKQIRQRPTTRTAWKLRLPRLVKQKPHQSQYWAQPTALKTPRNDTYQKQLRSRKICCDVSVKFTRKFQRVSMSTRNCSRYWNVATRWSSTAISIGDLPSWQHLAH